MSERLYLLTDADGAGAIAGARDEGTLTAYIAALVRIDPVRAAQLEVTSVPMWAVFTPPHLYVTWHATITVDYAGQPVRALSVWYTGQVAGLDDGATAPPLTVEVRVEDAQHYERSQFVCARGPDEAGVRQALADQVATLQAAYAAIPPVPIDARPVVDERAIQLPDDVGWGT